MHLSLSLAHLASLIRKALRSLQGEDPEDSSSPLLFPSGSDPNGGVVDDGTTRSDDLEALAARLSSALPTSKANRRDESEGGYIGRDASTRPHYIPTTSTSSLVSSPPRPGTVPLPKETSAINELGPVDEALEREIEFEALRRENEELRRLLGISTLELEGRGSEEST